MKSKFQNSVELIKALSECNPEAYKEIYITYYKSLCYYANRILNDLDESEDLVQNIILKLWESPGNIGSIINLIEVSSYIHTNLV